MCNSEYLNTWSIYSRRRLVYARITFALPVWKDDAAEAAFEPKAESRFATNRIRNITNGAAVMLRGPGLEAKDGQKECPHIRDFEKNVARLRRYLRGEYPPISQ